MADGPGYDGATALIVVDVQNDFADPSGSLAVPGAREILEPLRHELEQARAAGATVVYTLDWHPPDTPHFQKDGGVWPVHCVAGTWGAELDPGLPLVEGAEVVRKGVAGEDGYSAFAVRQPLSGERSATGLDDLLRGRGVTSLVVVGLATDYCVKETVLDGLRAGFAVRVLTDAVRAVDLAPGDGASALDAMREAGAELR